MFIQSHGFVKPAPRKCGSAAAFTESISPRLAGLGANLLRCRKKPAQPGEFLQISLATESQPEYTGSTMLDETQQQSIVTRLNRVEGQIRGIRRMVQEPRLCVELLQQLSAAEAALNRISLAVFKAHIERCVPDGITQGEPEKSRQLGELVDIFDRFAR
jgi:DNA-binding FrmR family transcriptional regulator